MDSELTKLKNSVLENRTQAYGTVKPVKSVKQQIYGEPEKKGFLEEIIARPKALGRDMAEIFPEVKQARERIQEFRVRGDTDFADELELKLGKKSNAKQFAGNVLGTVMLAAPVPAFKALKLASPLKSLMQGYLVGSGFGAAEAMAENKKFDEIVSRSIVTGLISAPIMLGGNLVFKYGSKAVGKVAGKGISKIAPKIPKAFKPISAQISEAGGEVGRILSMNLKEIQMKANKRAGTLIEEGSNYGLTKIPRLTPFQKKQVPLLTKEEAYLGKNSLRDVEEGVVSLNKASPKVQTAFGFVKKLREDVATELRKYEGFKERANFARRIVPKPDEIKLSRIERYALENAKGAEKKLAIRMGKKNSLRRRVLFNAVERKKEFKTYYDAINALDGWAKWVESGGRIEKMGGLKKMISQMIYTGEAKTEKKAIEILEARFMGGKTSSLKHREYNFPFYDPDPRAVIPSYIYESSLKIEQNKYLSPKIQEKLLDKIQTDVGIVAEADVRKLLDQVVRAVDSAAPAEKISIFMRTLQIPKLSFAQILNLGQNTNTFLETDLGSLGFGLKKAFTDKGVRDALKSGANVQSIMRQQMSYIGGGAGGFTENFLKYSGFTWTEIFNRTVAANAGQKYAEIIATRLSKNPTNKYLQWQLKELGINPNDVIKRGKLLDKSGKFDIMEKEVTFGVAPYVGKTFTDYKIIQKEFTKKGFIEFNDDILRTAKSFKVQIVSNKNTSGMWKDTELNKIIFEPSKRITIKGNEKSVDAFGASLGKGYKQQAIYRARYSSKGKGSEYVITFKNNKDAFEASKTIKSFGIEGGQVTNNKFFIGDTSNGLTNNIKKLYAKYREQGKAISITKAKADISFPNEKEYGRILERVDRREARRGGDSLRVPISSVERTKILEGALLTNDEKLMAGAIVSKNTQFFSDPLNLPAFVASPYGKVFFQYKSFAYNQMNFITKKLANPNIPISQKVRTLVTLATLYPMSGEVTSDIRALITGRKRPTKAWSRYAENIANAGTFGLALDFWQAAKWGNSLGFIAGPSVSSVADFIDSHAVIVNKGKIDPAMKFWLQQSGVGRVASNRIWQTKRKDYGEVFDFYK